MGKWLYWQNVRGVSVLESFQLHFQFSIHLSLFFSCKPTVLGKKHTRTVCWPTRQAAETMIRSVSCSLQLRLKSNECKKFGDKMLKATFGYYNLFLKRARFPLKKMQLLTKLWLIRTGTINSSTWLTLLRGCGAIRVRNYNGFLSFFFLHGSRKFLTQVVIGYTHILANGSSCCFLTGIQVGFVIMEGFMR